jgi:hypothetical protein
MTADRQPMRVSTVGAALLRSISPATGALAGGLGVSSAVLATIAAETVFGDPSSTTAIGLFLAPIFVFIGAAVGAKVGALARMTISRSRWAGPVDRFAVAVVVLLAIAIPGAIAVRSVLADEAWNTPRVIVSSGDVVRAEPANHVEPTSAATLIWELSARAERNTELRWNGNSVRITFDDGRMTLRAGTVTSTPVDLRRFDYVRQVHGISAALQEGHAEWLAVLLQLRLRETGGRELLAIFDPTGKLAYQEVLERRTRRRRDTPVLWSAGQESERQEFIVDVGPRLRYYARP